MRPPAAGGAETRQKLALMRGWLAEAGAGAIRLRGIDWFAWASAGGSNAVLLAAETGVAEILVTQDAAYLLTDEIEAQRLADEEAGPGFRFEVCPWDDLAQRDAFVRRQAAGKAVISDRPGAGEGRLPARALQARLILGEEEQARYRAVGEAAALAMSAALRAALPEWSEFELAGAGARELLARGLEPALVLAAGAERMVRYRHPTPSATRLGESAMLVFCARGYGLYANLTRFVRFGPPGEAEARRARDLFAIEAQALAAARAGDSLIAVFRALARGYQAAGYGAAMREHHQGGITGYLAREILASARTAQTLQPGMALAFNPSLPGAKIEDTFLLHEQGLENLTFDPAWPSAMIEGRLRPTTLER